MMHVFVIFQNSVLNFSLCKTTPEIAKLLDFLSLPLIYIFCLGGKYFVLSFFTFLKFVCKDIKT